MIKGIGIDIVDVRRIEGIIFRWQDRFLKRLFTENEIRYCNNKKNPAQRFATRYAAKEAFIKALYPKGEIGISPHDVEVDQKDRRPTIQLYGAVKKYAESQDIQKIHLMLSHDGDYSVANVILEG